jgi:two-component system, sensor histidine kinase and response regulator
MSTKPSILYLDDESNNLTAFVAAFRREFDITTTTSVDEAVEFLSRKKYAVILSDQKMPDISGVEFFESIRHEHPYSVRVLVTGYADMVSVIDAINKGHVYRYISKPWNIEELKLCINTCVEKYSREIELIEKTHELEKSNSELEKFVYSASHDLKAPIASILGLIKVVKLQNQDTEIDPIIQMIDTSAHRLNEFVTNIIHYYQNLKTDEIIKEIHFADLIDQIVEKQLSSHSLQGIDIQKDFTQSSIFKADEYRLNIALSHLIGNAIKFLDTEKESLKINISSVINRERLFFKLQDNGVGIAPEKLPHIFDMFNRNDPKNIGSGIGLYIARESIHRLQGKISIESTLGTGTTIILEVPNKG